MLPFIVAGKIAKSKRHWIENIFDAKRIWDFVVIAIAILTIQFYVYAEDLRT